ncbi:prolyl oligopeptidase family serine peptidase [Jiulongibacter sediminis]|uniref:prolyl oligopeptidase family serine peptidase n=1 Tax=Jiulongibacter sediminis TaxID=1605367 RepID=UPI0026ED0D26|nr:prolyl oligopeptidase family serine peptidase [Jiulongibacter sediminis]
MKKIQFAGFFLLSLFCFQNALAQDNYTLVIEGFDWGPHASKAILQLDTEIEAASADDFTVFVSRTTDLGEIPAAQASGERKIMQAFVSDAEGQPQAKGSYITLTLTVAPFEHLGSAIQYFRGKGNNWVDYRLTIIQKSTQSVWNKETNRVIPILDEFDLSGKFTHGDITMSYGSFVPENISGKAPLLIWLHGGGEGGTDPAIAAIGNKAVNYASPEIQSIFEGAYVLVPQAPTFWMNSVNGGYTRGDTEDIYNKALMELIKSYVKANPGIDANRIYVGGCSNGGYMSLKLILNHPDYFAAGYISALAYSSEFITDQQIQGIKNVPIWFVQSKDDQVTDPQITVVPVYNRLKAAGAPNVHFSFYDHVIDITNQYGGPSYHYNGHWSWIYLHANESHLDYDGKPVKVNGIPVTVMQWLSAQKK